MADRLTNRAERIAVILSYVLPVLGGTIGIFWINATSGGSPLLGVAGGAVAGCIVAAVLSRLLLRGSDGKKGK